MKQSTMDFNVSKHDDWRLGLVVHDTVDDIFDALKGGIPDSEGCEIGASSIDSEGNEEDVSESELRGYVTEMGIYGFVEETDAQDIVHIWADLGKVTFDHLLFLFGHEVGHSVPDPEVPADDPLWEEDRADGYAFAAREAYRLATKVWSTRFKGGPK